MTFEEAVEPHVHEADEAHVVPPIEPAWIVVLQSNEGVSNFIVHAEKAQEALVEAMRRAQLGLSKRRRRKLVISRGAVFGPAPYAFELRQVQP